MYSRYHNLPQKTVQIPENYSGCAFSDRKPTPQPPHRPEQHRMEIAKPSLPPPAEAVPDRTPPEPPIFPQEAPQPEPHDAKPPLLQTDAHDAKSSHESRRILPTGLFGDPHKNFPFAHGIGFEELLLLGLIVLLSNNEQSSDIVLWLVLLLFCG